MLDHLSGGRLEIGIGRGLYGREALNLNPIADPRNEAQNRALFAETLEVMQKAWSDEFFSHHGHFYEFPQPGVRWNHPLSPPDERFADDRGMITKMSVTPRPLQRPHPPLWQVIDTPPSIEWAARRGIQGMFWLPPLSALKHRFALYRERAAEAGFALEPGERLGAGARRLRGADDGAGAPGVRGRRDDLLPLDPALAGPPQPAPGRRGAERRRTSTTTSCSRATSSSGRRSSSRERIAELRDELGLEHLLIWTTHPGLEHRLAMRSLELFAADVMPEFT